MIYVKEGIHYKRGDDLEIGGTESTIFKVMISGEYNNLNKTVQNLTHLHEFLFLLFSSV